MASKKALLAIAAKFLTDITYDTKWQIYCTMYEVDEIADNVGRLYRSQTFHDPDYPDCVHQLFQDIGIGKGEDFAIEFVKYVISKEVNLKNEEVISTNPELLQALNLLGGEETEVLPIPPVYKRYLNVETLPDDFYIELREQINKAFAYGVLPAVQILSRKFLENLVVDILRKKYGMKQVELFFDTNKRRFNNFEVLLKNLQEKIDDFIVISSAFDADFLKKVNRFREQGNSSAHTIELNLSREKLEKDAKDLEYIIKLLVKVYNAL